MSKDENINKVLVIGSGGIRIGQSAEFDYSGSQALKALKEEGVETVLVNPNVATIQTTKEMADKIYLEPITPEFLEEIIKKEKPDGILLGFGGQTALNCGVELHRRGILKKYGVSILGTQVDSIIKTEDRDSFRQAMEDIQAPVPRSRAAGSVEEAREIAGEIGYPVIIRPAYTLGGLGSSIVENKKELKKKVRSGVKQSPESQVLIEKYLKHWKEVEYEVVRDQEDNCITVCNMENIHPLGVHTGDSIVVAPSQTLSDREYHLLRTKSIEVIRSLDIIGECNIQFALDPESEEFRVIEVNPRLSRSSALASKATGYPLAYIAAKLGIGYSLPELKNRVTGKTIADFEPALDYLVIKIPRFEFQKFDQDCVRLDSQMKSIGEVMSIGRNLEEALQKAVRKLEMGRELQGLKPAEALEKRLERGTEELLFDIVRGLKTGMSVKEINRLTGVDSFYLEKVKNIVEMENKLEGRRIASEGFSSDLRRAKELGFSDKSIARLLKVSPEKIRSVRKYFGIRPVVKQIDTMAAEWPAQTNYLYFTYNGTENDVDFSDENKVLVLGAGPIRIGSSVEFDWCTVNCVLELKEEGYRTLVLNCNPETVSTDYDMSDKLYFDEITLERVLDIVDKERPEGVVVSFGGQTSNNLAYSLSKRGVKILGTRGKQIDMAENRKKFSSFLDRLGINQPEWKSLTKMEDIKSFAEEIGYPVMIRPSYVLSGSAMKTAEDEESLERYLKNAADVSQDHPVVVSKFIENAREVEVDGVSDGKNVYIGAVIEHIEDAGVHSGDAFMIIPPKLPAKKTKEIEKDAREIAKFLGIEGPFNIQFMVRGDHTYVIECNLRSSRSMPYVSKSTGKNLVRLATRALLGEEIESGKGKTRAFSVKAPIFSWSRLGVDPKVDVEMSSTGEVACMGMSFEEAFLKSLVATESGVKFGGSVVLNEVPEKLKERIKNLGFEIINKDSGANPGFGVGEEPDLVVDFSENSRVRKELGSLGVPVITQEEVLGALVSSLEKKPELKPRPIEEYQSNSMEEKETHLRVGKIENGTVIDHIPPNRALDIMEALNLREEYPNSIVSMVTNVPSKKEGLKDILKIEGKRAGKEDLKQIKKIAPGATVNIIKDFEVIRKKRVEEIGVQDEN